MATKRSEQLASLATDVLLYCILPFLRKGDQYQCLSTCKAWKPRLLETRSLYIAETMPDDFNPTYGIPNVYLWNRFLNHKEPQRLFEMVGCVPQAEGTKPHRKVRLDISMKELSQQLETVCAIADYIYSIIVMVPVTLPQYKPICIKAPKPLAIKRWLKSGWFVNDENSHMSRSPCSSATIQPFLYSPTLYHTTFSLSLSLFLLSIAYLFGIS